MAYVPSALNVCPADGDGREGEEGERASFVRKRVSSFVAATFSFSSLRDRRTDATTPASLDSKSGDEGDERGDTARPGFLVEDAAASREETRGDVREPGLSRSRRTLESSPRRAPEPLVHATPPGDTRTRPLSGLSTVRAIDSEAETSEASAASEDASAVPATDASSDDASSAITASRNESVSVSASSASSSTPHSFATRRRRSSRLRLRRSRAARVSASSRDGDVTLAWTLGGANSNAFDDGAAAAGTGDAAETAAADSNAATTSSFAATLSFVSRNARAIASYDTNRRVSRSLGVRAASSATVSLRRSHRSSAAARESTALFVALLARLRA